MTIAETDKSLAGARGWIGGGLMRVREALEKTLGDPMTLFEQTESKETLLLEIMQKQVGSMTKQVEQDRGSSGSASF